LAASEKLLYTKASHLIIDYTGQNLFIRLDHDSKFPIRKINHKYDIFANFLTNSGMLLLIRWTVGKVIGPRENT